MPERDDAEDLGSTRKALSVFRTLRTNLALFSSFARQSGLEPANYSGDDLEFLGVEPGENQLKVHNGAVTTILVALVTQALSNYFELKSIKPRLEDPEVVQRRAKAGDPDVVGKLSVLLYDFTQKCFMGDLKIWPLQQYENIEALDPKLRARMDTGEASFEEFIEALNGVSHRTPASHSQ